jgi:regulator of protease activity HflC (stomatin/prohibitin superfamily)
MSMLFFTSLLACNSEDIPQAHKGRMFDRTGMLALFTGGKGLTGPVLGPGTYFTGIYDELRMVDCGVATVKEPMTALTRDGVQFGLDIYVRYSADCGSEQAMIMILDTVAPQTEGGGYYNVVSSAQLYNTYVRGALGEAVRENVSPHNANDLNNKREEVLVGIRERFLGLLKEREKNFIVVEELNLSNMDFPDEMDHANTERAVQAVLKDKAIAERERVDAEIETAEKKRELAQKEGQVEAARIAEIGRALADNPSFLQYDMQQKMPGIYKEAGATGNMVITVPSPTILLQGK